LPSRLIDAAVAAASTLEPDVLVERTEVVKGGPSRLTKTSGSASVSSAAKLVAVETKTTLSPSPLMLAAVEFPLPFTPPLDRLTSAVAAMLMTRTRTSGEVSLSSGVWFVAALVNATRLPSSLIDGPHEGPSPAGELTSRTPLPATLRRKTSSSLLASPAVSTASLVKATKAPSSSIAGWLEWPVPARAALPFTVLMRVVVLPLRRYTCRYVPVPPGRLAAALTNATRGLPPLTAMAGSTDELDATSPAAPSAREIRVVVFETMSRRYTWVVPPSSASDRFVTLEVNAT
jgi:hypothetical protein